MWRLHSGRETETVLISTAVMHTVCQKVQPHSEHNGGAGEGLQVWAEVTGCGRKGEGSVEGVGDT